MKRATKKPALGCSCPDLSEKLVQDEVDPSVKNGPDGHHYLFGCGTESQYVVWNCKQQSVCFLGIFLFIYVVLFGILQWIMFHWATMACGTLPANYNFHGGGHGTPMGGVLGKNVTGPADNLLPRNSLIVGREDSLYGKAFDVFNSTNEGQMVSAPVGTWFRTWGPWFWTYTYQDTLDSKETVYMRPTILGMTGVMSELKVMRCDGKGGVLKFSEGTNVVMNWFRELFRTNTGRILAMLVDGERIGIVEETFHGQKSATFRTVSEGQRDVFGSCILRGLNGQGFNEWFLKTEPDSAVPFYMTAAVAANYAFKIPTQQKVTVAPAFLMQPTGEGSFTVTQQSEDIPQTGGDNHAEVSSADVPLEQRI